MKRLAVYSKLTSQRCTTKSAYLDPFKAVALLTVYCLTENILTKELISFFASRYICNCEQVDLGAITLKMRLSEQRDKACRSK